MALGLLCTGRFQDVAELVHWGITLSGALCRNPRKVYSYGRHWNVTGTESNLFPTPYGAGAAAPLHARLCQRRCSDAAGLVGGKASWPACCQSSASNTIQISPN